MQSGSGNAEKIERYAAKAKIRTESKYLTCICMSVSDLIYPDYLLP